MQMAHTLRSERLRSMTQTKLKWFGRWRATETYLSFMTCKGIILRDKNIGHVSDWRNHIHNSHGLKRALDQSLDESMGAYAECVSWDCPGCVSAAREGLGHCLVEFGDV